MIHIRFKSDIASIRRQVVTLLESETNSLRGPQLGKHLLSVVLHQLGSGLVQDVFAFRQCNEQRLSGFALVGSGRCDFLRINIDQSDGRFRAIQLRITRRSNRHLAVTDQQLNRLLIPKTPQRAGEFAFGDGLQRPV